MKAYKQVKGSEYKCLENNITAVLIGSKNTENLASTVYETTLRQR